ncbi:MAG: YtxH domain-containing protein [Bacteroidota bacterium]|jgi:gas vesicle protein
MANDNNGTTKGFIFGLLAGSAIGAVLALLYAPKSGKELRADIKAKTDELMSNAENILDETRAKLPEISSEAKKRSEQVISEVKSQANSLLQDADKVLSSVKHRSGSIVEEGMRVKDAVKAGMDAYKQERNRS